MFKSLQWKIVIMFLLLVLSVLIIAGTIMITQVGDFYSQRFSDDMEFVFNDQQIAISNELTAALSYENPPARIAQIIDLYSDAGRLGINQNRNYYILDGKTAQYVEGSDPQTGDTIEKTPNIIKAMNGEIGNEVNIQNNFMDYAYPIISNSGIVPKTGISYISVNSSLVFIRTSIRSLRMKYAAAKTNPAINPKRHFLTYPRL